MLFNLCSEIVYIRFAEPALSHSRSNTHAFRTHQIDIYMHSRLEIGLEWGPSPSIDIEKERNRDREGERERNPATNDWTIKVVIFSEIGAR